MVIATTPPTPGGSWHSEEIHMTKALLTLSILVDAEDAGPGKPAREVYSKIGLYKEDGQLVWRAGGPLGDEVEVLPRPSSTAQAKADARAVYPVGSAWKPRATWL
jgi:hypothetical protein